jgi:hypothetical protein
MVFCYRISQRPEPFSKFRFPRNPGTLFRNLGFQRTGSGSVFRNLGFPGTGSGTLFKFRVLSRTGSGPWDKLYSVYNECNRKESLRVILPFQFHCGASYYILLLDFAVQPCVMTAIVSSETQSFLVPFWNSQPKNGRCSAYKYNQCRLHVAYHHLLISER